MSQATSPAPSDAPGPAAAGPSVLPITPPPHPLSRIHNRLLALPIFLAGSTVLGLAAWMQPNTRGMGTHQQLGLPPCSFEQVTGLPCATCGCTTSFAYAAEGSLLTAFVTQPFGALLAILTAMAVLVSGYALVTNMPLAPVVYAATRGKVVAGFIAVLLLAWGYNILRHMG
ncbi:MAG: DUF2752 domain-containing protein [Phycisphaerales bacterium JB063]